MSDKKIADAQKARCVAALLVELFGVKPEIDYEYSIGFMKTEEGDIRPYHQQLKQAEH